LRARRIAHSAQLAAAAEIAAASAIGRRMRPAPVASRAAAIRGTATASGARAISAASREHGPDLASAWAWLASAAGEGDAQASSSPPGADRRVQAPPERSVFAGVGTAQWLAPEGAELLRVEGPETPLGLDRERQQQGDDGGLDDD